MLKIKQAFTQSFIDQGFFHLDQIAHENISFTPENGTPYAEISVITNDKTPFTVDDADETDGIFRVILRYPENTGSIQAGQKADKILNFYKIGSRIHYENVNVIMTRQSLAAGVSEAGWHKLVLTINYRTFLRR